MSTEWTTEMRYRPYHQWDEETRQQLITQQKQSPWHLSYHIQPNSGLLNDPNGFSYFNGRWHLFYQLYPFGPVHGLKSWYHLSSTNLVDWQEEEHGLLPDTPYDSHGVYSGTAIPVDDRLLLAYTGNVRDEEWTRYSYQLGAWMDQDNQISKIEAPLIPAPPAGYTTHFRDPQVIAYEQGYLLIIGAQNEQEEGKVLVYQGPSVTDWTLIGELNFTKDSMGFMVECPNLVFIDQRPVLIFCPQGMDKTVAYYDNIYPNMVVIGDKLDVENVAITNPTPLQNLDAGFDVYATQAFNAPDGRVLSVGWAGLPELAYPTDAEGWAHCLTLVRELSIKDNRLYQQPAIEHQELRQEALNVQGTLNKAQTVVQENKENCYELSIRLSANSQGTLSLFADEQKNHCFALHFDAKHGKISLDRSQVSLPLNTEFGQTRTVALPENQAIDLHIFVDQSICEIFVNDGQHVLTSRVFPQAGETNLFIEGTGEYTGTYWKLRSSSQN
ncbi:sucrose-6-phosphate hydrolase [Enterococcus saccharolyticus]|uniref:Sucrose-6-phosphate hydrolase n=1 Tax=Candidatus Enterococcus willemsii TaxID=1857215 RepID=A0ABQ6Z237_9ENTE|nr:MULTISPECIES: sucrose-6-phosphate hydrolase [Enterococcus]KAF1305340.1 sucrose-6-phosphate hydrolase [Enterococcus sp. CU12B]MCD5002968.1 sucrose-6-phosphate hydrolase [Enterococcus saccharolyticus]